MTPSPRITFHVRGTPQPKGSTRIVPLRARAGGKPLITSDNPKLRAWQHAITWTARTLAAPVYTGPVSVGLVFSLTPPKRRRAHETHPQRRPDVDKLARAVLDALTGVLLHDDGQVVDLHAIKQYGDAQQPGVVITVATARGVEP